MKRFLFLALFIFVFSLQAAVSVTGYNPDWTMYYSFDNLINSPSADNYPIYDYRDLVGGAKGRYRDLNGSIQNPDEISTSISGGDPFDGYAVRLDGSHYVKTGDYSPLVSLGESYDHEITISLWVKFSNSAPNGNDCFIAKNTDAGGDKFLFGIWDSQVMVRINSNYRLQTYVDGTNGSTIDVYDSNWHHFAVAIKEDSANPGTSKVTLWIDGSKKWNNLTISNILSDTDMTTGQIPSIGMDLDGSGLTKTDLLEGYIDELQIFSALATDDDVANLYNKRFGVIADFDVWANGINQFNGGCATTSTNAESERDKFTFYKEDVLDETYYYYTSTHDTTHKVTGSNVTNANFIDTAQNNYEVIFHSGHGSPRGPRSYTCENFDPEEYAYGVNSTRWIFYHSCYTLSYPVFNCECCNSNNLACQAANPNHPICEFSIVFMGVTTYPYSGCCAVDTSANTTCDDGWNENAKIEWFEQRFDNTKGATAILGFASTMWFKGSEGTYQNSFWEDISENSDYLWYAYSDAVYENMGWDTGVRPAIVYRYDTGKGFDGRFERINNVYRPLTTSSMSVGVDDVVIGSPHYVWMP